MKMTFACLAMAIAGCANGQGDLDVTTSKQARFPVAIALPGALGQVSWTTATDVNVDVHDQLASMAKVGTLSVTASQDSVSGADLALVDQVTATIASADGTMPVQPLASIVVPTDSVEVELSILLSSTQALAYLREGPVVVHLTLTGALPERPITLTYSLGAKVAIGVAASVQSL
jgi:hypothetical protein